MSATATEKERMRIIKEHMPCLPCMFTSRSRTRLPEVHHMISGMRRLGNDHTYALCPWHHRGFNEGRTNQEMTGLLGPSYAHGRRGYQEWYGPEKGILKIQDFLLDSFAESPWIDYNVPNNIRREAVLRWTSGL